MHNRINVLRKRLAATVGTSILLALATSGCGGSSMPAAALSDVNAEIQAAEVVGARDNPRAALHLKLAQDQLQEAEALSTDGEEEKARLTLERARIDAQLAITLTKEAAARREAEEALEKINQLSLNETGR